MVSNWDLPDLYLLNSWDYGHENLHLTVATLSNGFLFAVFSFIEQTEFFYIFGNENKSRLRIIDGLILSILALSYTIFYTMHYVYDFKNRIIIIENPILYTMGTCI
jgi:hypothetical protein